MGFQSLQEYPKRPGSGPPAGPYRSFQSLQEYPKRVTMDNNVLQGFSFQSLQEYPKQKPQFYARIELITFPILTGIS